MEFKILGKILEPQLIAQGHGIRELVRLRKVYGSGYWRKLKGVAQVLLPSGRIRKAEVHWYEAHGIGKKEIKIKRFIS